MLGAVALILREEGVMSPNKKNIGARVSSAFVARALHPAVELTALPQTPSWWEGARCTLPKSHTLVVGHQPGFSVLRAPGTHLSETVSVASRQNFATLK